MSQPVMANPISNSLSGLRNGRVFLALVRAVAIRPIVLARNEGKSVYLNNAHHDKHCMRQHKNHVLHVENRQTVIKQALLELTVPMSRCFPKLKRV